MKFQYPISFFFLVVALWPGAGCSSCFEKPVAEDGSQRGHQWLDAGPLPVCGNGILEPGEECDDGNYVSSDGCHGCLVAEGWTCEGEPSLCHPVCGDGRAVADEVCDGPDLREASCRSLGFTGGTLRCSLDCRTLDTRWCTTCGNGILEDGEECDCGEDPDDLPEGCDDVNGGEEANCTVDCRRTGPCTVEPWSGVCDPTRVGECCPDEFGAVYECVDVGAGGVCLEPCSSTLDCYVNMMCSSYYSHHCMPAECGPRKDIMAELNGPCLVPGGYPGYCLPQFFAEDETGLCVENGARGPGEPCDDYPAGYLRFTGLERTLDGTEFETICANGLCGPTGTCWEFCDWRRAYESADVCAQGFNCLASSYFYLEDDPDNPWDDFVWGHRTADQGLCVPQDPSQSGAVTCDLADPDMRLLKPTATAAACPDLDPDPSDATSVACSAFQVGSQPGEIVAVPVGECRPVPAPTRTVYEECDPDTDICPANTLCLAQDLFAHPDNPDGPSRCLPFCNAETAGVGTCRQYGDPPGPYVCTSLSAYFAPRRNGQGVPIPGETSDDAPAPLGLCACPPSGCP